MSKIKVMGNLHIEGKILKAIQLRGYLYSVANAIPWDAKIIGSADQCENGSQCTFAFDDIALSIHFQRTKGDVL